MYNERDLLTDSEYSIMLREQLGRFSAALKEDKTTIYIPGPKGLWEKTSDKIFHLGTEIFFQFSGSCIFEMPWQRVIIRPGDVIIMQPGMPHTEKTVSRPGEVFRNIVYMISGSEGSVHIAQARKRTLNATKADLPYPAYIELLSPTNFYSAVADSIVKTGQAKTPLAAALKKQLLNSLVMHSMLDIGTANESKGFKFKENIQPATKKHYKVALAKRILNENMAARMPSVRELAAAVKCSPNYLSSIFHELCGKTIKDYINDLRLDYAKRLIETTSYNISEIAWSCGFQDAAYFAKMFRARFGCRPMELRGAVSPGFSG